MAILPVSYSPIPYASNPTTLGQLLQLQSQHAAINAASQGQIAQQLWANLGHLGSSAVQEIQAERVNAPIRARQAEAQDLELGKLRDEKTQRETETAQAKALRTFVSDPGFDALPDDKKLLGYTRIAGPLAGPKLFKDYQEAKAGPKPIEHDPTKELLNPLDNTLIRSAVPKVEKPTTASLALDAAGGDQKAADALKLLKPQTEKGRQAEWGVLDGKQVAIAFDPGTGKRFDADGNDVTARVKPIPPASVQVALTAANANVSPMAKAIAEYRSPPPSPRSMTTPAGEGLMRQVLEANPSYDATQYPTRAKMRQAFTSGPQSQTINSLNTAIGHLDQFTSVVKALDNGNFRPGNEAYNWLRATFGDSAPTNFAGIKSIMAGELASAFKKSGATDQEIASVEQAISGKNSAKQLLDYVQSIALPALGSKVVSFEQQYRQVMGEGDPFKILLPESEAILKKYNIDPAHPQMGGAAKSASPREGTEGSVNGVPAVWKTVNGKTGWYAK